jgi:hypothetical protein
MRVTATFSDGLKRQLDGKAVGEEFDVQARARIVRAEETLIDVSTPGGEEQVVQGELEVHILLTKGRTRG